MNDSQKKAIKSLERAFKKCYKADICFFGNGSELMVFDSNEFSEVSKRLEAAGEYRYGVGASEYSSEIESCEHVNTSGTLVDSGGA